jgi:hypothetical protein
MENTAFTLTGEDGDAVEAYKVSGNKYEWRNLQTGTYTLSESKNDDGFIPVNDITVEVSNDGTITCTGADDKDFESTQTATNHQTTLSLYNYDKSTQVLISKTDINGTEELEGAELKVYRADDETEIVDSWTSTTGSHKINKTSFETDVVYVLEETTSPFGYEVTESIRFKIDTDGNVRLVDENGERLDDDTDENSSIIMKDDYSYLKVLKTRSNLKPLSGAGMQITDANDEVKDSWVSTTEAHLVQIGGNLEKNIEYTLSEVSVPYGYEKAADIKFMLDENENIKVYNASSGKYENYDSDTLSMIDMTKKIYISKTDITNGEELPGASITITDADGNEVVPGWTSTDKPHSIDILNFEPGTEYYFTEITAPDGYEVAETIVFKLDEDGRIYVKDSDGQFKLLDSDTIVMKDEPVTESDEPVEPTPTPTPTPETSVDTPTTTETSTATASTNVKTGDNVPLKAVAAMMVVSLLTLIGMGIYRKLDIKDDED